MIHIKSMLKESSLVDKAREFAKLEHTGVKRRVSGLDYFTHPHSVARMAKSMGLSEDEIILAYLHDTYEDSQNPNRTIRQIQDIFGPKITEMVKMITHEKSEKYPSYVLGIAKQSPAVLRIKLLDMYCNMLDSPSGYQVEKYTATMEYLLQKGINEPLIQRILNKVELKLG
jgi:(p)ppGpp synthase/HD superfamily hydrolase